MNSVKLPSHVPFVFGTFALDILRRNGSAVSKLILCHYRNLLFAFSEAGPADNCAT